MDGWPTGNAYTVFLVNHLVFLFEIKLVSDDLASRIRQYSSAAFYVPREGLYQVIYGRPGPQLWCFARPAIDMQWRVTPTEPAANYKSVQIAEMIRMQMTKEYLVNLGKIGTSPE